MRFVVALLHLHNMGFGDEFVQECVAALIADFILNRNQHILQVHYSIFELYGAFWNVGGLPGLLGEFLLSLRSRLGLVLRVLLLHVLDKVSLRATQLLEIVVLLLGDKSMQLDQRVTLRGQLEAFELADTGFFLELGCIEAVLCSVDVRLSAFVDCLLNLFVHPHDRQAEIVPELGIPLQGMGRFLEVFECLEVFTIFEKCEAEIV